MNIQATITRLDKFRVSRYYITKSNSKTVKTCYIYIFYKNFIAYTHFKDCQHNTEYNKQNAKSKRECESKAQSKAN